MTPSQTVNTGDSLWRGRTPDARETIDSSCSDVLLPWYASAVGWLVAGSVLGVMASIKLHTPWFLADAEWLTFGRIRPAHLNTLIYGWASMSGVATLLWLTVRLCKRVLPFRLAIAAAALYWNAWVAIGTISILSGYSTSVEWLEFPWWVAGPLGVPLLLIFAVTVYVFSDRRVEHIYVSQWYVFGATIWFPFLYVAASILIELPAATGVMKATANWWFAHNVLGLWLTPIGLASAYYLIPKVLGRPIHSYYLSILGFWTLAIFYNWAGTHHLVGGPLPAWLVTVGIVGSMMMFVPVVTVAVNHHFTVIGHFGVLATSPTLRFTVFGAMSYTLVSVQGSLTSLRVVNEITHFTHYTIAHAHLGVYAFYTMIMFGAMYYILPRLVDREWISSRLIRVHFWCSAVGIIVYWVGLTLGGVWQGMLMNDPDIPFLDIVGKMIPFLWSRSLAGGLMTVGHVAFAISVWHMLRRNGAWLVGPTLFNTGRTIWNSRQQLEESRPEAAPAAADESEDVV